MVVLSEGASEQVGDGTIKGGIGCKVRYEACALQPMPLCVDSG